MALKKQFLLFGGQVPAEYIRFHRPEVLDDEARTALLIFRIYATRQACEDGKPHLGTIRLLLTGGKFDQWFARSLNPSLPSQAYLAAKAESVDMEQGSGLLLADAEDV